MGHFFPFYPTNNLKNQNFEKMKKTPRAIINLHKCTKNWNNLIPEIWCVTNVSSIFHFGLFFALLSAPKKQKFLKIKKRLSISFCTCVQKIMITWCMVPEIWCPTDGQTYRWTEKVTYTVEMSTPPKNVILLSNCNIDLLNFFDCYLAAPQPTLVHYQRAVSLTHC